MKKQLLKIFVFAGSFMIFICFSNNIGLLAGENQAEVNSVLYEVTEFFPAVQQSRPSPNANQAPIYDSFNFNNGTVQDWTTLGPLDEEGDGPFASHFSCSWADAVNYPTLGLTDPIGNSRGSYKICNVSGHGITNPGATYWYMYWVSPNLSTSPTWQTATGYSVKLLNYMELIAPAPGTHLNLAVNFHVTIYDQDQARDRYFRASYEEIDTWFENPAWISKSFAFSGEIAAIAHKTIKEIMVSVRGRMADYFEGGIYLDEIVPTSGGSGSPMISLNLKDIDFGMKDNNLSFKISNAGAGTLTWTVTENPNKTWITSISPSSGSGNATVQVGINRNLLTKNVETGTLLVASNGGNENITISAAKDTISQWIHKDIETKLTAKDGAELDLFGRAVAIEGIYAAVGASDDDNEKGVDAGAVYILTRSGETWTQTTKLVAPDGAATDYFGYSLDIDGDYMVVGSCWDDDKGAESGSAYIYHRSGSTWNMEKKITASDGGADNRFGIKTSISGNYVIVGAFFDDDFGTRSGSAYIYERTASGWVERKILHASDGAEGDWFGVSVSIDGDYAVVGSRYDDNENGTDAGAVYVFKRSGTDWIQEKKIIASDGAPGDLFNATALNADILVVGAYQDDDKGNNSGSLYIYKRSGTNWIQSAKCTASDGAEDDNFGSGLAIQGNRLIAGAYRDNDHGENCGSIYIFDYNGTNWLETEKIISSDGDGGDYFGNPVDIYQNYVIVAARNDDDRGTNAGAAYIYKFESNPVLAVTPTTLDFGIDKNSLTMSISNTGSGTLSWNVSVTSSMPWLSSITPSTGTGNATVTVNVDRTKLTDPSGTGTLNVISNGGDQLITLLISSSETVSVPETPTGPATGKVGQVLSFISSGSKSSLGHNLEYQFDWGDGIRSGWYGATQNHAYTGEGTMQVKARARCQTHTSIVSDWSAEKSVAISWCQLTLSVNPTGSGSVSKNPDKTNFSFNDNVTLTANANTGYLFDHWSGDLSGSENPKTISMNADKNVTAHFMATSTGLTHFTFKKTDESYSIVLNAAKLDNVPLAAGDEIGIFTPAGLCVGASVWTGTIPLSLVAWKDDAQTASVVDGYKDTERISFRVWDKSAGGSTDYPAQATFTTGNGNFGFGVYSIISMLEAYTEIEHNITLKQGWNWISTNVTSADLNVEHIFSTTHQLAILVNGAGQFYIPSVINGIGNWNTMQGYKIYVNANDAVTFKGQRLSPTTPMPLATGWNFISYLPENSLTVETALSSIISKLAIAKQDDGQFFIPGVINTIGSMKMGEGYKLYLNSAATLTYPAGSQLAKTQQTTSDSVIHFVFAKNTGESYSIVIDNVLINNLQAASTSEIAVFVNDTLCVGAVVWNGISPLGLIAWGDDQQTTEKDGYAAGDTMSFRIWNATDSKTYNASAQYSYGDAKLGQNIYSRISILKTTNITDVALMDEIVPDQFRLLQNYPNPFNPETQIEFDLSIKSAISLMVFDLQGHYIRTIVEGQKEAGHYTVVWDGRNSQGELAPSGVYIYRLSIGSTTLTNKMVLLK